MRCSLKKVSFFAVVCGIEIDIVATVMGLLSLLVMSLVSLLVPPPGARGL